MTTSVPLERGRVDKGRTMKMFVVNFFMANVREMVNVHLPVMLKLINSASLVTIVVSTLCAAESLKQMGGDGDAPAAMIKTD